MTKREIRVSTWFLAFGAGSLFAGGASRILSLLRFTPGSTGCLFVGALLLVLSIIHIGMED